MINLSKFIAVMVMFLVASIIAHASESIVDESKKQINSLTVPVN